MTVLRRTILVMSTIASVVFVGCENTFDPKGIFKNEVVVFSILNLKEPKQFVRVYSTYDTPGFDPLAVGTDNPISDAVVTVHDQALPGIRYSFIDSTITRLNTTRYTSPIHSYVSTGFQPVGGRTYVLTVASPTRGSFTALTAIPTATVFEISNTFVLREPSRFPNTPIAVRIWITYQTKGYVMRFLVKYKYTIGGIDHVETLEVPTLVSISDAGEKKIYATLTRRKTTPSVFTQASEVVEFDYQAYTITLTEIRQKYGDKSLVFQEAVFILTQVETNLYNYYSVVNGFQDDYSIRTDQPDYSNVNGAVGLFGGRTTDTLNYALPAVIN
jgi:hypothetical protein